MNFRVLVSTLLSVAVLGAFSPPATASFFCNSLLERVFAARAAKDGPLAPAFFRSPELFFTDGGRNRPGIPFYASNEFDWQSTPWDDSPTDVLVGFGTNSAWDLAVRKNAKQLVVADWVPGPLIAQKFIHRALLRIAKSPVDFIFLLSGMTTPAEFLNSADMRKAMPIYIRNNNGGGQDPFESIQGIKLRLQEAGASSEEEAAILSYYDAIFFGMEMDAFGMVRGKLAHRLGNMAEFFMLRYFPEGNFRANASEETSQYFSFLSSQAAFNRFKEIYQKSLYAHTDYRNRRFYEKLKSAGDTKGHTKYTFSLSNVFDAANGDDTLKSIDEMNAFRKMIYEVFPSPKYEVLIFFTTSYGIPHNFYRLERSTRTPDGGWMRDLIRLRQAN